MAVIRGGYWRSSEADKFPPDSISKTLFTHLFYATVAIDPNTYKIHLSDIDNTWMERFTNVTSENSDVKCFLSIGEDTEASRTAFSKMVSTSDGRKTFIDDSIYYARLKGFHGLDLYWKYPAAEKEFDMRNLGFLFKEWRESVEKESSTSGKPRLLLSTVAYFAPKFFPLNDKKAYPFEAINDNVDFVNLVCYDYYGSQDVKATAEHALLNDQTGKKSTDYGISSWIKDSGVPKAKFVMGLPLYGRTWTLEDPTKYWIGAPATGVGPNNGVMDYSDILKFKKDHGVHAVVKDDPGTVSTYLYAGQDWIGYDSEYSIKGKVQYAKDHALGGYFFWALGMDEKYILPQKAFDTWN